MSIFEFDDQQGVRTRGTLRAPGATPGDVLTIGATHGTVTPSPGGGSSPVLLARKYLDHAAILALPSGAVELAPAPGPGKMIWPQTAVIYADTSAGAYSNFSDGSELGPAVTVPGDFLDWLVQASNGTGDPSSLLGGGNVVVAPFIPQTFSGTVFAQTQLVPLIFDVSGGQVEDTSLKLMSVSNDGNFEDGHVDNFLVVAVTYSIIDLTP